MVINKRNLISFLSHIILFIWVEILFVFLILREIPHIEFISTIWAVHISYWLLLVIAGIFRERAKRLWAKISLSYAPVVYHVLWHIYAWIMAVEYVNEHAEEHAHDEHSLLWLIIATISVWVIIVVGEWLLHRKIHCDTCHSKVHKHCKENHID